MLTKKETDKIEQVRDEFKKGDNARQGNIDEFTRQWAQYRTILKPNENDEALTLVDSTGDFTGVTAPRWVCHLLGLRHKGVHILLRWNRPGPGNVFVFQVRSWNKSDSPGHLDISAAGHDTGGGVVSSIETAYREMEEELGLTKMELKGHQLIYKKGYESYDEKKSEHFFNAEWRDLYIGEITTEGLEKIQFLDHEVVGIYLCPENEAENLINQKKIPIANALKLSLPYCLE